MPNKQQREKAIIEEKQKLTKKLGFDIEQIEKDLIVYTEGRKPKEFFLWNVYFAEVFLQKDGFDIVIGNPPYIDSEEMSKSQKELRIYCTNKFKSAKGNWDLYIPFFGRDYQRVDASFIPGLKDNLLLLKRIFCL